MRTYTMYWWDLYRKTHSMKFEATNNEAAKKFALKYHIDNITTWAVGLAVYTDRDVLIADWTKDQGRWHSNIRKKKKDGQMHPFGL